MKKLLIGLGIFAILALAVLIGCGPAHHPPQYDPGGRNPGSGFGTFPDQGMPNLP
jgi:hypothetical protein